MKQEKKIATLCVAHSTPPRPVRTHTEAIYATSAYLFEESEQAMACIADPTQGYVYSRWGNPTVDMAASKLAELEAFGSGKAAYARLFSSGMAAISAAILACCQAGDKILTQSQLYGTTDELMRSYLPDYGIQTRTCNLLDLAEISQILETDDCIKIIYIETPSNPLMQVVDVAAVCDLAARYKVRVLVDNTFCTPLLQQPLLLGAHAVVYSTTKFLNGHGTALGGAVVSFQKKWMQQNIFRQVKLLGANSNAFESWLLLQGMKTLSLRMERQSANAAKMADFLKKHSAVEQVYYPGLSHHPQYKIIKKQMRLPGAMLSFELKGGLRAGKKLMNKLQVCKLVTSLGTLDTLVQHPASMTHANVPKAQRVAHGISDGLVRMSVGIEDIRDLMADVEQALK